MAGNMEASGPGPLLWGITGLRGSGKNTFAALLRYKFRRQVGEVALADPLKESLIVALGNPPRKYFFDPAFKEENLPGRGFTARRAMQKFGLMMQSFAGELEGDPDNKDFWLDTMVHRVQSQMRNYKLVVCTDIRFPNEAAYIKSVNGKILRVMEEDVIENHHDEVAKENPSYTHASETSFFHLPHDYEITNSKSRGITAMHSEMNRFCREFACKTPELDFMGVAETFTARDFILHILISVLFTGVIVALSFAMGMQWVYGSLLYLFYRIVVHNIVIFLPGYGVAAANMLEAVVLTTLEGVFGEVPNCFDFTA